MLRVKVLFWNDNVAEGAMLARDSSRADPLARLVRSNEIDLIILADCDLTNAEILAALEAHELGFGTLAVPPAKVRYFRKLTAPKLIPAIEDERFHLVRLIEDGSEEILIGATHLYDRQNTPTPGSRRSRASRHVPTMLEAESYVGHDRTILVGDFNSNSN